MASSANAYREDVGNFSAITFQTQLKAESKVPEPSFRDYPIRLLRADLFLILRHANLLVEFLRFIPSIPTKQSLTVWDLSKVCAISAGIAIEQLVLLCASVLAISAVIWTSLVSGGLGLLSFMISLGFFLLYSYFFQSGVIIKSRYKHTSQAKDEKWFFINGICTGNEGIQRDVDFMARMFDRPIIGVHNKTNGFIFDILECIIQRDFAYATQDGTVKLYELLKKALLDPQQRRVVLVAHSQGGIISSLILDNLLSDIPQIYLQKLEIYTFGNAANHFNSPVTKPSRDQEGTPVVIHIEHYANGEDFVARIGVLNWEVPASNHRDTRFYGKLFKRPTRPGHFLIEHYFESSLNPSSVWPLSTDNQPSRLWKYLDGGEPDDAQSNNFIDK